MSLAKTEIKMTVINEHFLRQTQAATIIAKSLHYVPESSETPAQIIKHAVEQSKPMTAEQKTTLDQMLHLAESVGIEFENE